MNTPAHCADLVAMWKKDGGHLRVQVRLGRRSKLYRRLEWYQEARVTWMSFDGVYVLKRLANGGASYDWNRYPMMLARYYIRRVPDEDRNSGRRKTVVFWKEMEDVRGVKALALRRAAVGRLCTGRLLNGREGCSRTGGEPWSEVLEVTVYWKEENHVGKLKPEGGANRREQVAWKTMGVEEACRAKMGESSRRRSSQEYPFLQVKAGIVSFRMASPTAAVPLPLGCKTRNVSDKWYEERYLGDRHGGTKPRSDSDGQRVRTGGSIHGNTLPRPGA
ncbi:hypothetical protein BKA70DRAFT_1220356 [Coprinopsis sp. MPI-PUGE-AT-0042]|nr:hypothetical protein BKA70DRAFT_1220356 [Coprinopsis sp. MPI-PUGE-AT-0042]